MNPSNNGNRKAIDLTRCTQQQFTRSLSSWIQRLPEETKAEFRAVLVQMATGQRDFLSGELRG